MEIVIKLNKEEKDTLISAIDLMERMSNELASMCGENCPFKNVCDERSDSTCFFDNVAHDLRHINNNCD